MAAAASSLKGQAQDLVQVVAAFRVEGGSRSANLPTRAVARAPMASKPAQTLRKPAATAPKLASTPTKPAKPATAATALPKPVATTKAKSTPAGGDDDWETF